MERPTPRCITLQVSEYSGLAGNCTTLIKVDGAIWKEQSKIVLERGHEIFGGETFTRLLGEYVAVTTANIKEQGFVDRLHTGITDPSYDCSKSSTRNEFTVCASPDLWAID